MDHIIVSLLNGVVHGLLLFMVSAGLTLIFGMMGVLNFAHASFYMLGAYFALHAAGASAASGRRSSSPRLSSGWSASLVERYFLRRVHHHGHAHELLLTFGLSFIIEELIKLFFGNFGRLPDAELAATSPPSRSSRANYPVYRLLMGAVAIAMFAVIYLLLTRTRVGIVVRSAIYRPRMVEALGHNVPLVFMGVFGVGAALAGLAGAVAGAFYTTSPNMALELGVIVFVVVVVGGLGSLGGAMLASLLIGLFTSLAVGVDAASPICSACSDAGRGPSEVGGLFTLKLSTLAASIPFALMLLILLVRPAGLMGDRQ